MIENLLLRSDVQDIMVEIVNNERYYQKQKTGFFSYIHLTEQEIALLLFYDALEKYQIIIEDITYFDSYLEQIKKLIKKIDNFEDISIGIYKALGNTVFEKLGYPDQKDISFKQKALQYIYDKYIINGYYFHGISAVYQKDILKNGFLPGHYTNLYPDFMKAQNMCKKHGADFLLDKDFSESRVFFTDSFFKSLYYSVNSPFYFRNLICNPDEQKEKETSVYSKCNQKECLKKLKHTLSYYDFSYEEKSFIIELFQKEWNLLNKKDTYPCVMLVKRSHFQNNSNSNFSTLMEQCASLPIEESITKLFRSHDDNIACSQVILPQDISFISCPSLKTLIKQEEQKDKEEVETIEEEIEWKNTYGKISLFVLVGLLLITLGVLITVVMLSRGR